MRFGHDEEVWQRFAGLVPGVLLTEVHDGGERDPAVLQDLIETSYAVARDRLRETTESGLPEIQAWRRAFADMGLKPTQYRCASEALLRRFRKEDDLPRLHPLVDLGNALSLAWATPVAVIDVEHVSGDLLVGPADGTETYRTFGGDDEHPEPGEIVFADSAHHAHARRWTNRQSGLSAVGPTTRQALIVTEALHDTAPDDVPRLVTALSEAIARTWAPIRSEHVLSAGQPVVDLGPVLGFGA